MTVLPPAALTALQHEAVSLKPELRQLLLLQKRFVLWQINHMGNLDLYTFCYCMQKTPFKCFAMRLRMIFKHK